MTKRPSYSAIVGTLALVVALSGSAYAVSLAENSVGTKHLKDGAVTTPKLDNGAVDTPHMKKSSVTGAKVANGSLQPIDLSFSSMSVDGHRRVYSGDESVLAGETEQSYADCPGNKRAVGGGWYSSSYQIEVSGSRPEDANTWVVDLWNTSGGEITVGAWAVCVKAES